MRNPSNGARMHHTDEHLPAVQRLGGARADQGETGIQGRAERLLLSAYFTLNVTVNNLTAGALRIYGGEDLGVGSFSPYREVGFGSSAVELFYDGRWLATIVAC